MRRTVHVQASYKKIKKKENYLNEKAMKNVLLCCLLLVIHVQIKGHAQIIRRNK